MADRQHIFQQLLHIFSDELHPEIIKSVAISCNWNLTAACNHLSDMSCTVKNNVQDRKSENTSKSFNYYSQAAKHPKSVNIQPKPTKKVTNKKSKKDEDINSTIDLVQSGARVCIILRGPSGCGKSTLARFIINKTINKQENIHILSTDDYFLRNGRYVYDSSALSAAHAWNQRKVAELMKDRLSPVIVDNTNIQYWEMKNYIILAVEHGYEIRVLEPSTSWFFNLNELLRKNIHNVPRDKVKSMIERYEPNITGYDLIRLYNLKYSPNNRPPQPSSNIKMSFRTMVHKFNTIQNKLSDTKRVKNDQKQYNNDAGYLQREVRDKKKDNNSEDIDLINFSEIDLNDNHDLIELNDVDNATVSLPTNTYFNRHETVLDCPKIDLTSLDTTNEDYSWTFLSEQPVVVDKTEGNVPHPQKINIPYQNPLVESTDASTNTNFDDFSLFFNNVDNIKILNTTNREINDALTPIVTQYKANVSLFDKSTMTGNIFRDTCTHEKDFSYLKLSFPEIPENDLRDIFNKCKGDVYWVMDILLESYRDLQIANIEVFNNITDNFQEICNNRCNYFTMNSLPSTSKALSSETTATTSSPPDTECQDNLKNQVSDDALILKLQLENCVMISDQHYSKHVQSIRKQRYGETEPSTSKLSEYEMAISGQYSEDDTESSSDNEIVDLNIGPEFILELEKALGYESVLHLEDFHTTLKLPMHIIKLLHSSWIESVYRHLDNQTQIVEKMMKEDEELAKKLQEEEMKGQDNSSSVSLQEIMDMEIALAIYKADQNQLQLESSEDIATRMKKQKLFETFPNLDKKILEDVFNDCSKNLDESVEVLKHFLENEDVTSNASVVDIEKQNQLIAKVKQEYEKAKQKPLTDKDDADDLKNSSEKAKTANQYREEAMHNLQMRHFYYNKAQEAIQKKLTSVATYYSEIAQLHKQRFEQANARAASAFLVSHAKQQKSNTLDLHFLYVREAEEALSIFLDEHINNLITSNKDKETLQIITGRGKRSKDGKAHIKSVVKKHLALRKLNFKEINPGSLKVTVTKYSILTNNLK